MTPKIITIDGPSGVGKGTIATMTADHYDYHLLDSGALYRVVAVNAQHLNLNHDNPEDAAQAVTDLDVTFKQGKTFLHQKDVSKEIRTLATGQLASKIAIHPVVRDKLFDFMQRFVCSPGIVADGRDMGTVVFPQANIKFFLTASAEVRAKRRHKQLSDNGKDVNLDAVFSELAERDKRDKDRETAPLEPAQDAVVIDTGNMDIAEVFDKVHQTLKQNGIRA